MENHTLLALTISPVISYMRILSLLFVAMN